MSTDRAIALTVLAGVAGLFGASVARAQATSASYLPTSPSGQAFVAVNAFPNLTFQDPTFFLVEPGTNKVFVCGREGQIWTFNNNPNVATKTLFLDLSAQTQGYNDSGLVSMAFHPQFGQPGSPNRGYIYVYYNYTPGPIVGSESAPPNYVTPSYDRLSRFTVPDGSSVADPNSELVLVNQFDRDLWHNGGAMFFGPDGYLYFTNGDEGGKNDQYHQTQKINSGLFSGVFRIDVDKNPATSHPIRRQPQPGIAPPAGWPATYSANYYIPNDNPWQDPSGGTLEEFYALGFRNPFRMTLDPATGWIWLGDVGQNLEEEIDLINPAGNYQWSYMEGVITGPQPKPSPLIGIDSPPIYAYPHANGNGCVVGGYVYHGTKFASLLGGQYIFADYDSNNVFSMSYSGSGTPVVNFLCTVPGLNSGASGYDGGITSLGLDGSGEIYICTVGPNATIYKLALPGAPSYLENISARAGIAGAGQPLTGGFVVQGSASTSVLLRGVGPTLAQFGVPNPVPTPALQVFNSSGAVIAQNTAWSTPSSNQVSVESADSAVGAFALPAGSADCAVVSSLGTGSYTIQVTGQNSSSGVTLAEIYDASPPASGSTNPTALVNLSARAQTGSAPNVLIAGFVIEGSVPLTVLVRGIGPTLAQFGVSGVLSNPQLQIFNSASTSIAQNTGWGTNANAAQIAATATTVGAFALPAGSNDDALLLSLPPGVYTAEVSGANGTSGQALVEVYAVPY